MVRRWSLLAGCLVTGLLGCAGAAWSADNMLFVPLAPCRVIDTRVSGAGGPLVAGTPRTFIFRGPTLDYQSPGTLPNQGGSTTGCGIPSLTADSPSQNIAKAVAINIVAVGPAGAGDLRAWPANQSVPTASVINYAAVPGLNIANGVIVPMCDQVSATPCASGDITFRADVSGTQLVVDVVGYFHAGSTQLTISNTALGHQALVANTTGTNNTVTGANALSSNTTGYQNTASGVGALGSNTTGLRSTAIGYGALFSNTTGNHNLAIGYKAGYNATTGNFNIFIANRGVAGESDKIRIGIQGTQNATYVAGIAGVAVSGSLVGVTSSGQLGTSNLITTPGTNDLFVGGTAGNGSLTGTDDVGVGPSALQAVSTGSHDTALGSSALAADTSGHDNTAIGHRALVSNTTGYENTATGTYSLSISTTGKRNTAMGYRALFANTTGWQNTAIADNALSSNTTGVDNNAIGFKALASVTTGFGNVALGSYSLESDTASFNTAVGHRAMEFTTGGTANTALGTSALFSNTTGSQNTAVGFSSAYSLMTGINNTAVGFDALLSTSGSGGDNTAIGAYALKANSTGSFNVAIGVNAGAALTTGYSNIDIANAGVAGESKVMRIGTSGSQSKAFIAGIRNVTTDNNDAVSVVIDSAGQLGTVSSSIRFKEDVHDLGAAADRVLDLRPVSFRYKKPFANGEKPVQYGLIAEEVEKVLPELVAYGQDGRPETVKYQVLPTLLLGELEREHAELRDLRREKEAQAAALRELRREKDEQVAALSEQVRAVLARLEQLERESQAASRAVSERPR